MNVLQRQYDESAPKLDSLVSILNTCGIRLGALVDFTNAYADWLQVRFSTLDDLLARLDSLYDLLASMDAGSGDYGGINARLDTIIGLLAASAAADWADALLGNLDFADLLAKLAGLGEILESAFPFCLVFMVIEVLEVFSADPVAPSFDFDVPIGLHGEVYSFSLDLMDYDGLAVMVRYMLFAMYCVGLFMSTKDHIYSPSGGE